MYNISSDSNMCLIISIGRKTNLKSVPISNPLHGLPMRAFPVRWCRLVYQLYFQAKRWRIRKSLDGTQERTEKTTTVRNVFWACEKNPKKTNGSSNLKSSCKYRNGLREPVIPFNDQFLLHLQRDQALWSWPKIDCPMLFMVHVGIPMMQDSDWTCSLGDGKVFSAGKLGCLALKDKTILLHSIYFSNLYQGARNSQT